MTIGGIQIKRRVWICLLFAVAATGGWWVWQGAKIDVVLTQTVPSQPVVRLPKAGVGTGDALFRERAEYFDPTPLFFPTEWNFGHGALRESMKRQPGDVFGNFDAQLVFGGQNIKSYNGEVAVSSAVLADVVMAGNEKPLGGIGEIDVKPVSLPERSGFIEIKRLGDGKTMVAQSLIGVSFSHEDFAPVELLVVVSTSGMVAEPILVNRSGWEDVDSFLRTYLAKTFRVGERLAPGMYRVLIGP